MPGCQAAGSFRGGGPHPASAPPLSPPPQANRRLCLLVNRLPQASAPCGSCTPCPGFRSRPNSPPGGVWHGLWATSHPARCPHACARPDHGLSALGPPPGPRPVPSTVQGGTHWPGHTGRGPDSLPSRAGSPSHCHRNGHRLLVHSTTQGGSASTEPWHVRERDSVHAECRSLQER